MSEINIEKLGGHSPEEILDNRTLYEPIEPDNPELAHRLWSKLERHSDSSLSLSMASRILILSFGGKNEFTGEHFSDDRDELAQILTVDSLEWYLHQDQEARLSRWDRLLNLRLPTAASGLLGGVIMYQATDPNSDIAHHKVYSSTGTFVIPEKFDGILDDLHDISTITSRSEYTYIGNVRDIFAQSIPQASKVTLIGSAGDRVAEKAGFSKHPSNERARVTVKNNVGNSAASYAESLILTIGGDAGNLLGMRAGFAGFRLGLESAVDSKSPSSVLIRVEGGAGGSVAHKANGNIDISVSDLKSEGDRSNMNGSLHIGPYPPGHPKFKEQPGRFLR